MTETTAWLRGLGFVAGGAVFWLMYFDWKDRLRPEPRRLLAVAYGAGFAAAGAAFLAYRALAALGVSIPAAGVGAMTLYCLLVVGPVEEGAKFLSARLTVFRRKEFDEPIDGLIYASMVAIGFATVENVLYLPYLDWRQQLARSLTSPLTHSLMAAPWGFAAAQARLSGASFHVRLAIVGTGLAASIFLHGIYDTFLLAFGLTLPAAATALALWIGILLRARRLVGRARLAG